MRFSRVLAVAASVLSGAALCQLPSAAQSVPVPVDFSGAVDTACEQAVVTPGDLAYDNINDFSSDPSNGGENGIINAFSCNTSVEVLFEGVSAAATNPIGLAGLSCDVELANNSFNFPQSFAEDCDGFATQLLGDGQIFGQTTVSLDVFSPGGGLPAGFYSFTVDLSIVPN